MPQATGTRATPGAPPEGRASREASASPLAAALAALPDDASVTVTLRVHDLRAALAERAGGPMELTTKQAAERLGRTPDFWARAAERGDVVGAYRHGARGPWRLPRTACEALLRSMAKGAARPEAAGRARGPRSQGAKALRLQAAARRGTLTAVDGGAA